MAVHTALFFRRSLPRNVLAALLLALLVIGVESSVFGGTQPAIAKQQAQTAGTADPPLTYLTTHGNTTLSEIALTFDDGPAVTYTKAVLDILRQYHVPATFFMLGTWVQRYPDLARAVVADGHAIGNHTWDHPNLTTLSTSQITKQLTDTRNIIQQVTGVIPTVFRPPYGSYNTRVLDTAFSLKFSSIIWSCDPTDWSRPGTTDDAVDKIGRASCRERV